MILEIDVGNTFLKWRVVSSRKVLDRGRSPVGEIESNMGRLFTGQLDAVCMSCVSSLERIRSLRDMAQKRSVDFFLAETSRHQFGVTCGYDDPSSMGVDRWLAIVASYNKLKKACLVVDAGSAMTVDLVDSSGHHLGGYIVPGMAMMRRSLLSGTENVKPQLKSGSNTNPAKNTSDAVNNGLLLMMKGMLVESLEFMADQNLSPEIVLTGGDGKKMLPFFKEAIHWPDLVLDGLSLAYQGR